MTQAPAEPSETAAEQQLRAARFDFYLTGRWSGPAGTGAAAALWATLVTATERPPATLAVWFAAMLAAVALQIAAFSSQALVSNAHNDGLPKATHLAHLAIGIGFGLTLWLDLDATRDAEFRWLTLACLFAMSAGVIAGFSGVNRLGQLVNVPMWAGTAAALVATEQLAAAAACGIFAVITTRDMAINGRRWNELLRLRITSAHQAHRHRWEAHHDSLTNLPNRAGFMASLESAADEGATHVSLMFIDLDHFKEVNDRFGHATGDAVLVEASKRISGALRRADIVGRLGGDEFAILLGDRIDEPATAALALRIIDELERPIDGTPADDIYISASIGLASMPAAEATPERLLMQADHAMYRAKRTGRRQVVRFDGALRSELRERRGLESRLRRAIQEGGLSADGQPVFNIQTGEVRAVELLARWRSPGGTSIPPSVFIPLAEEIGLIGDLTASMLRTAGVMLNRWKGDPLLGNARVTVNVSAVEFARGDLVDAVAETIEEFGISEGKLVLELTESQHLSAEPAEIAQFEAMRSMGVLFAIDDFGTGYSSLDQLLSLPIDGVKLDQSLSEDLGTDPARLTIMQSVHNLASVIGTSVTVEGIEEQAQLDALQAMGATDAQGFFLCRPTPVLELEDHLARIDGLAPIADMRARAREASPF